MTELHLLREPFVSCVRLPKTAVYVVGANASGQLGLGDLAPRDRFEVVPETRGAGVSFVAAVSREDRTSETIRANPLRPWSPNIDDVTRLD